VRLKCIINNKSVKNCYSKYQPHIGQSEQRKIPNPSFEARRRKIEEETSIIVN